MACWLAVCQDPVRKVINRLRNLRLTWDEKIYKAKFGTGLTLKALIRCELLLDTKLVVLVRDSEG